MRLSLLLGPLVLAAVLGPAACSSSAPPTCDAPTQTISVELKDFSFEPSCIESSATATLTLRNTGSANHTFTINGTGVDVNVNAGDTASVRLSGLTAGTIYAVVCTYHSQMVTALKAT